VPAVWGTFQEQRRCTLHHGRPTPAGRNVQEHTITTNPLHVSSPGNGHAVLTLPQPLTPESLLQLEQALASALGRLHHEVCDHGTDPGQLEYASWLQQLRAPVH
jgi:hypothetical protein